MRHVFIPLAATLAALSCSCSGSRAPDAKTPTSAVFFEPDRGPPPQLPNPMMVADSLRGGDFESCYRTFRPSGNAVNDLAQMTASCGPPNSMKAVTPVLQGTQSQTDPIARFTFRGELGRCYRIFAASTTGIQDLDMAMLDPAHAVIGHDTNEDAFPILNPDGPLCVTKQGNYTVLVSVERGAGNYALQVWGF